MEREHRYFRLGLFVILTVAALLAVLFILGGRSLFDRYRGGQVFDCVISICEDSTDAILPMMHLDPDHLTVENLHYSIPVLAPITGFVMFSISSGCCSRCWLSP